MKTGWTRIHFLNDVFAAVAVLGLKVPVNGVHNVLGFIACQVSRTSVLEDEMMKIIAKFS